ncbi:putative mitochondrial hypothetical protein [Leptomonas pyrrhocoris]|uniref:Fungal lipase-like domain-containing protein n=1 Tax=Leptomonas pyrrhocoris TaxID=157538 RepID=A0A0M9G1N0_LEPPY|nr:putative mitochondrial hypothetical protein [Leptomonas pyrrhocoris]KPA80570.1 putative mitochondrial hypothetical protein [Leptomonas pyrrhocoris]|eukprot:XP_015659009.1 putative mitochondrial hypothetical protein [Leptomonas pyrrhocoris]
MGIFASRRTHGAAEQSLSLDVVASRPKLEPHDAASLRLTSHGTYATLAAHVYGAGDPETGIQVALPDGWEVLLQCPALHLDCEGYFAVAYIHRRSHHCIIAQRGTSEVLSLRAGVWIYFEQPTIQFFLAEQFSKAVRHTLASMDGGRGEEWFVTYTGHSLGAVIATCRAVEEGTLAVTFESPGARAFIEKILDAPAGMDACAVNYLRAPNPINSLKPHCGYGIVIPTQQVRLPSGVLFLAPSLPPPPVDEDVDKEVLHGGMVPSRAGPRARPGSTPPPPQRPISPSKQNESSTTLAAAKSTPGGAVDAAKTPVTPPSPPNNSSAAVTTRSKDGGGGEGGAPACDSGNKSVGSSGNTKGTTKMSVVPTTGNAKYTSRWRIPSFRPQQYLRDYVFSNIGMGIPELQQYVSKIEPMIREMLEHTQQVHSIHSMRIHFERADEPGDEEVVLRWPEHLLQFMEFYNTFRALEDPENQEPHVREAYRGMMRRLYSTEPRRRDCIPLRCVDRTSQLVVRLWWSMDATQRKLWPLSLLDHKALNVIYIKDGYLCSYVLSALQAKQYLMRLVATAKMSELIDQWRKESVASGSLLGQSRL